MSSEAHAVGAGSVPLIPNGRLGTWVFLSGEVVIFGGLIASYVLMRLHHPDWAEHASHALWQIGALNTVVLLTSSLTVVLAHDAAHRNEKDEAAKYLIFTILCGFIFLGVKAFEYSHEFHEGFYPTTNLFWSFYFLMTGLHALHIIGGLFAMTIVLAGVRRGRNLQRVEYVGLYWHVVDVVWIFLFPLLYIAS